MDFFSVCVKVFEANDLPHPEMSTLVGVQVGAIKKYTPVVNKSSNPYFNEYFAFDIKCEFSELMSTVITLSLYEGRQRLRGKRLVGTISLDVATVWAHLDRVMRKSLPLVLPSDVTAQTKAFVSCEIIVEAPEVYKQIPQIMSMETPNTLGAVRGRYMIKVYRCIGMDAEDSKYANSQVYVSAEFAGLTGTTTKRNYGEVMEWNEQLTFIELFPPLFQKIRIGVYVGKYPLVTRDFFLTDICNVSSQGHLPTYGPTYVHMYSNVTTYRCSLLMAIDSETITSLKYMEKFHGVTKQTIKPTSPNQYGRPESFLICGVLFDALLTDKKFAEKDVTFSVSFGSLGRIPSQENFRRTEINQLKAVLGEEHSSYLLLNENKPCIAFRSEWPDTRHRLSNSNIINKVTQELRERVNYARDLIARGIETEAKTVLKGTLENLQKQCSEIPNALSKGVTPYDFERARFITEQLKLIASSKLSLDDVEQLLESSNKYLSILEIIYENVQDSLPNLVLTLAIDRRVVGYHVMLPRQVFFSNTDSKRGLGCGKINSIILKSSDESSIGRIDVWLWLGFFSQVSYCLKLLPPGHQELKKMVSIPPAITYTTKQKYSVICHIFGGHILGGMDEEGLCDSKVSVMISNRIKQTKPYKRSLVPLWKETLVFQDLRLYPTSNYLKDFPTCVTVQLLSCEPWPKPGKLIGSATVSPNVRLQPISKTAEYNLEWISLENNAQVLAAFEIIQITDELGKADTRLSKVMPRFLDIPSSLYKVEVVFWGIRPVDVRGVININNPHIMIQCNSKELRSGYLSKPHIFPNFEHKLHSAEIKLPAIQFYSPPFVLRVVSSQGFVGCNVIRNVNQYICELPSKKQRNTLITNRKSMQERAAARHSAFQQSIPDLIPLMEIDPDKRHSSTTLGISEGIECLTNPFSISFGFVSKYIRHIFKKFSNKGRNTMFDDDEEEQDRDWWFKYYSGMLEIFESELEQEFNGFSDVLKTYDVEQNKSGRLVKVAKAKIMICLYKWPVNSLQLVTPDGEDPSMGVLRQTAISDQVKLLVRVYCVKAHNLHPCDANGKSDPYIEIATQTNRISDSSNYIQKELNPVFGKCLELTASFPIDTQLVVRVMDWDFISVHDLIGETIIDIENRYYSKHRATCGLSQNYYSGGYDSWRDIESPTKILEGLCNTYNLPLPQYYEKSVVVASKEFMIPNKTKNIDENENRLALMVLHNWKNLPVVGHTLVPEHVETRPLFNKERPGTVQGTIEMWIDMFDLSLGSIPTAVDISARPLQSYELRVIIWNTTKVPLVDDSYLIGRKSTDIFVKGWLGDSKGVQSTDVHYTSINGDGNFNWRFIFPLLYNKPEKKMVIYKKGKFDIGKTEYRIPPEIVLQVWDHDKISSNDFIGSLTMNVTQMPVGSKSRGICSFKRRPTKTVNLFKIKRIRGWWPFIPDKASNLKSAGLVEAEFHLLTAEEALASPAGLGRSEPGQLPPPIRPEFRTKFWLAPFRIFAHLICLNKGKIFVGLFFSGIVLFFLVGIYSIPFLLMKKLLGA